MRLRRTDIPIRMDMTPLIDVVFLLLTFFIFALVMMVRADVLDIRLPEIGGGEPAVGAEAIVITLDREGAVFLEGQPVEAVDLGQRLAGLKAERPDAVVMVSADERAPSGDLISLADRLVAAGVREFSIAGTPTNGSNPAPPTGEE